MLVGIDERADIAVLRSIGPAIMRQASLVPSRSYGRIERLARKMFAKDDREQAFVHWDVNFLAFPGLIPMMQCRDGGKRNMDPHNSIGEDSRRVAWLRRTGLKKQPRNTAHSLDQVGVGRLCRALGPRT